MVDLMFRKIWKPFRILFDDPKAWQALQTPTSNGTQTCPQPHLSFDHPPTCCR